MVTLKTIFNARVCDNAFFWYIFTVISTTSSSKRNLNHLVKLFHLIGNLLQLKSSQGFFRRRVPETFYRKFWISKLPSNLKSRTDTILSDYQPVATQIPVAPTRIFFLEIPHQEIRWKHVNLAKLHLIV